jgi:heptose I phosphotransferase
VCSQSRQEWEHSLALQASGLATAGLVACGEKCGPLWEKFSFILTEAAPGQTLERFLRECQDRTVRRRVCDALALTIRHLHAAGCAMPDLFTRHIFVELRQGAPTFCLIDLARLDRRTALPRRLRARDLAALNITAPLRFVSLRERIRFLRQYAGGLDRSLARQVAARMAHLLKRRKFQDYGQRRGAPDA